MYYMYSIFMGHSIGHKGKIYENLCVEQQRMVHSTNKNGELNNKYMERPTKGGFICVNEKSTEQYIILY